VVGLRLPGAERPGGGRIGWLVLPGGAREVGSDDVGGVSVQAGTRTVIPHRGPGISVRGGFLHIAQRHPGIQSGDERMPERVRSDRLADVGAAGNPPDDPGRAVPVQPPPIGGQEDRPLGPFADREVDGSGGARRQRDGDDLAAFAGDGQRPVASFQAEGLDVGAGGLGHPQAVEGQQRDQRVLGRGAKPRGNEQRAQLVAVQPGGMRLIVQPRRRT